MKLVFINLAATAFAAQCWRDHITNQSLECGYPGITKEQCENKDCCFDPRNPNSNWCFHSADSLQKLHDDNILCDYNGVKHAIAGLANNWTSERQCKDCWNPNSKGEPWCFKININKDQCNTAFALQKNLADNTYAGESAADCRAKGYCYSEVPYLSAWCHHNERSFIRHQKLSECKDPVDYSKHVECGFPGITEDQCNNRGCCFHSSQWCYHNSISLNAMRSRNKKCDYSDNSVKHVLGKIGEGYFGEKNCAECWNPTPKAQPWCFKTNA